MDQPRRHRTRPTRVSASSRLDQILDESAKSLNSKGVSLTTLGEIADRRGVSRPALYYYVKDLEDLVFQTYRRSCEVILRYLDAAIETGGTAPAILERLFDLALAEDASEIAALGEIGILPDVPRRTILSLYEGAVARLANVLEAGIRRGELRRCDAEVVARTLISIVFWLPIAPRSTSALRPVARAHLLEVAKDLLLQGWSVERREAPEAEPIDLTPLSIGTFSVFDRESILEEKRRRILAAASHLLEKANELDASCLHRLTAYAEAASVVQLREDIQPLRPLVGHESLSPEARAGIDDLSRRLINGFTAVFAGGIREGSLRDVDLEATMLILPGASSWLVKGIVSLDAAGRRHVAREISNLFTIGLASGTASDGRTDEL